MKIQNSGQLHPGYFFKSKNIPYTFLKNPDKKPMHHTTNIYLGIKGSIIILF